MILNFIERRFSQDCNWQDGNCYYFAKILTARFPELCIYYLPVQGHFVAGQDNIFYDSTGEVTLWENEKPIKWDTLKDQDPLYAFRVARDCIM